MNNVQKILFAAMILLAVFWGNYFNNGNQANGNSENNPAEFSALGSSSFLAQSLAVVESAGTSRTIDSGSLLEASAPASPELQRGESQSQTGGNSTGDMYESNAPEPGGGASNDSSRGTDFAGLTTAAGGTVFYRIRNSPAPAVSAQETLVADFQSGETYFETNADARWPMASLAKLLTAAMVMKEFDLKTRITFAPTDFSGGEEMDFFKTGSEYSAGDILNAMLLLSKNEAAEAFANNFSREKFINGLNETAAEWDMKQTYFADPTGLSVASQSTVRDMQKLALRIYQNYPKIFEITRQKKAVITELGSGKKTTISNINNFAGRSDFLGGKTGYTDEASGNLVSIFSHERRPILIIVLGTNDRFGETEKLFSWFKNNFRATTQ